MSCTYGNAHLQDQFCMWMWTLLPKQPVLSPEEVHVYAAQISERYINQVRHSLHWFLVKISSDRNSTNGVLISLRQHSISMASSFTSYISSRHNRYAGMNDISPKKIRGLWQKVREIESMLYSTATPRLGCRADADALWSLEVWIEYTYICFRLVRNIED